MIFVLKRVFIFKLNIQIEIHAVQSFYAICYLNDLSLNYRY